MEQFEVIKQLEKEAGITNKELSERADLEYSYVCKMVKGEVAISPESLIRLCNALGVSVNFEPLPDNSKVVIESGKVVIKVESGKEKVVNGNEKINGWDKNGKWLGDHWINRKGDIRPLFRRDPELSKEQNDADAAAFKLRYPGTIVKRKEPPFKLSELKTTLPGVYIAPILEKEIV